MKDEHPKRNTFLVLLEFKCSSFNATFYVKTKRHFNVRVPEHNWTYKSSRNSTAWDLMLVCNNTVSVKDFPVVPNGFIHFRIN